MSMTWQEKLEALQELGDCSLRMRKPGNWYVSHNGVEIKEDRDDGMLSGSYGNGEDPEHAVEDHWRKLVDDLPPKGVIVLNAMSATKRRGIRWTGHMWKDVL